ncbi:MAG: NADH:flavin oxidoreductase, partial [Selenomonadaceae bacterium]|nr:NADH:flavin oxidoreductase [Selenomonadaceae bacterium]
GIDSIEVSGNGTSVGGIKAGINEGYFADFAVKLADMVSVPVICVGGWRSRQEMEKFLNQTHVELISLSRPLVREPDLPKKFLSGSSDVSKCVSCNACYRTPAHRCIFGRRR